jgi:hypothetical protein
VNAPVTPYLNSAENSGYKDLRKLLDDLVPRSLAQDCVRI